MAKQVKTVAEILSDLNQRLPSNPWHQIPLVYTLDENTVNHATNKADPTGKVLVLKAFINHETGEIRTYLAKWTDDSEAKDLP